MIQRRSFRFVAVVWACFVARGLFYCSFLPLWEGYDEWAHFAHVERMATGGGLLVDREERVSREVQSSLGLAPVPWEMREWPKPALTQDEYWLLAAGERAVREAEFRAMPRKWSQEAAVSGERIYEALQPPLYYWLMSLTYMLVEDAPLAERVWVLRVGSVLIASLTVPLIFLLVCRVVGSEAAAVGAAAVLALLPGLMVNVSRVGNECLGIVLFSALTLLFLDLAREGGLRRAAAAGIVLGLGLLTKAYFLTAIPAVGAILVWRFARDWDWRGAGRDFAAALGVCVAIAGWWYAHNRVTTGTWTGLNEAVMLRQSTWGHFVDGVVRVRWERAVDAILMSHVWYGGWSSLVVRSWMYHFFFVAGAIAAAGVAVEWWRSAMDRRTGLFVLLAVYGCFWIGQLYNVLLLFLSKGVSTSMGWYMYCVVAAELALMAIGWRALVPARARGALMAGFVFCVAALDVYTVHFVSIPYYTGLVAHRPNGFVASFHVSQLQEVGLGEVLRRLAEYKASWLGPAGMGMVWVVYIVATSILIWMGFRARDWRNIEGR